MKRLTAIAVGAAAVFAFTTACLNIPGSGGGSGSPAPDAGPGPDEDPKPALRAPAGGVALQVESARFHTSSGELQVSVRFANGAGGAPVVLASPQFQLKTDDGLLIMPKQGVDPGVTPGNLSSDRDRSRPDLPVWIVEGEDPLATYSLAGDSRIVLRLRYEVVNRAPVAVLFTEVLPQGKDGERRSAESLIVFDECVECNERCTYTDFDRNNCGACGVLADDCVDGKPLRYNFNDVQNCGSEGRACKDVLPHLDEHVCRNQACAGVVAVKALPDMDHPRSCRDVCEEEKLRCEENFFWDSGSGLRVTREGQSANQATFEYHSCDEDYRGHATRDDNPRLHCGCAEKKPD